MGMTYSYLNPAERAVALTKATGLGDASLLDDNDAFSAERSVKLLELKQAFYNEHATSVLPNGVDPDAALMAEQRDARDGPITQAKVIRDRIVSITLTDVSVVMQPLLDTNRAKAETDYHDAEWMLLNTPGLPQQQQDALQLICDRAEREVFVIDNWVI